MARDRKEPVLRLSLLRGAAASAFMGLLLVWCSGVMYAPKVAYWGEGSFLYASRHDVEIGKSLGYVSGPAHYGSTMDWLLSG